VPEGDTLWRTANALRPRLVGKRMLKVAPDRLHRLEGATVTAVEAHGKHLLVHFDSGFVLHSHLRMTGAWHLYRPGEAWRKPERLAKAVLGTDDTVAVLFSAPIVELLRTKEAAAELAHLGPDILAAELDLAEVLRRARACGRQALGELLLDQRVAAGIGNIYKCESLFRLRLDPWRPAQELSDQDLAAVFLQARELMLTALHGRVQHFAHCRTGRACPRCSGRIACRRQGIPPRFTYFCSTCQKTGLR
jgi:endonuclease-8